MDRQLFIVQPYKAKAERLIAQPAQIFADEKSARQAGRRLARFRTGVVVASQCFDPVTGQKDRPAAVIVHGHVPDAWNRCSKAA